jgi:hypothetical protein
MRLLAFIALAAAPLAAQNLISAKSGLVHYVEGDVLLAGKPVETKMGVFSTMKPGETLATGLGRAEVLLAPGVFLRLAENSQIKMVNAELSDTRLELISGSAIVEAAESIKENKTTIAAAGRDVEIRKDGVYTIDAERVRVWDGEAAVGTMVVKGGRELALTGDAKPAKFDDEATDSLYRWAKRRSGYIALANLSGAKSIYDDSPNSWRTNGWYFNSLLGMYTYVPGSGRWNSPFGWAFFSPVQVVRFYEPVFYGGGAMGGGMGSGWDAGRGGWSPRYNPNLGYSTIGGRTGGGVNGGIVSGGSSAGAGASGGAAGGGGREGGAGVGRGSGGARGGN